MTTPCWENGTCGSGSHRGGNGSRLWGVGFSSRKLGLGGRDRAFEAEVLACGFSVRGEEQSTSPKTALKIG